MSSKEGHGDFQIFWPLKDALRERQFRSYEEVKVHDCLAQQPEDFFSRAIHALV